MIFTPLRHLRRSSLYAFYFADEKFERDATIIEFGVALHPIYGVSGVNPGLPISV
jgi:hypothetical protein